MTLEEVKSKGGINLKNWNKRRVHIVVTYDCNLRCAFCINHELGKKRKEYIKIKDIKYFLVYLKYIEKIEDAIIVLLGGEPTMLPIKYIQEIANEIHSMGYKTEFYTNGKLREKLLKLDGYIDYITISNYSKNILPFENNDFLYKFKKSTITISKLITKQDFPTFETFDSFVDKANNIELNYDFSILQKTTPNYELYNPDWIEEKLIAVCDKQDINGYVGTALYKGRLIKMPSKPITKTKQNTILKLYPNGNVNTTWKHDNTEIDYKSPVEKILTKRLEKK